MLGIHPAVALLRRPDTIRRRCDALLALAEQDRLEHFALAPRQLDAAADYVVETIRARHPDLAIPYHARWRHFAAGGHDRWAALAGRLVGRDMHAVARIRVELCVISVLLDAGAGPAWCFLEGGTAYARSEGLAVASLHAFAAGLFSADRADPLRVDAAALARIDAATLGAAFQVTPANPLAGLEGRAALLRNLGTAMTLRPDLFHGRLGGFYDDLRRFGRVTAADILAAILECFSPIWPSPTRFEGIPLGDVWPHPQAPDGLVPFHKLSQWMAYSLVEVFEEAGIPVLRLDALTGLPEYRNGGLLIDTGVLALRDPGLAAAPLPVDHPAIVEWRALTVALLDRLAQRVRTALGRPDMPLARILEGGTWAAGRRIAAERRPGGAPPIAVLSDGTVF
jgi:hypothetical protein